MRVMGIDQSFAETGICVIDWADFHSVKEIKCMYKIVTDREDVHVKRIAAIRKAVTELIMTLKPDHIVREEVNFGATGSANNLFDLGGVAAVVDLVAFDQRYTFVDKNYHVLNITTAKIATFGDGNFSKKQNKKKNKQTVQNYINLGNARHNIKFTDDNILDAYMMAWVISICLFLDREGEVWNHLDQDTRRAIIDVNKLKRRGMKLGDVTEYNCFDLLKNMVSR